MDFTTRKIRDRLPARIQSEDLESTYPHNVMLYLTPPTQDITLPEFEELAIERLKVLRILEQASSKNLRIMTREWQEEVHAEMNHEHLKPYLRLCDGHGTSEATKNADLPARRRDYISHFILRLAYCRSQDLRRWFISRELELFKLKFSKLSPPEIRKFLDVNKLDYKPIGEEEKSDIKDGLHESTASLGAQNVDNLDFYCVPFTEVPELIRSRRCFVKSGLAYVCTADFVSIIAGLQENYIENGLALAARFLPEIENDQRIVNLLKQLHFSYTGKDYALGTSDKVPIECIDQLSKKSYPLCMRFCHETLRSKHHLKHHARLQYGLFLKGIGVTLEDALRFWREEFTKQMDLDKFERSYAYNIRYNYGKEGQQKNWAPHSCLKVIGNSYGPESAAGCPFKFLDANTLRAKLNGYGIASAHAQEISSFATKGHYQIACAKYFEAVHDTKLEEGITHPNQFFDKSQSIINGRVDDKGKTPKNKSGGSSQEIALKKTKMSLLDEYDDEIWQVTRDVEQSHAQTTQFKEENDEFDETFSQMTEL